MATGDQPTSEVIETLKVEEKQVPLPEMTTRELEFHVENLEFVGDSDMIFDLSGHIPEVPLSTEVNPEVNHNIDLAEIARAVPNKMAFKIGEVADITGVKPYVLRYWETEFDTLSPQKSAYNQRMYLKKDVETVLLIKNIRMIPKAMIQYTSIASIVVHSKTVPSTFVIWKTDIKG